MNTDWSAFDTVLLRSTWTYAERLSDFLARCERVDAVTQLQNPLPVVRWSLNKTYMADLSARGVPAVPSTIVPPGADSCFALREFLAGHPEAREIVVKPSVGAYSKEVLRFARSDELEATSHLVRLLDDGCHALLLLYGRVDVIRGGDGAPMVLELELGEPSLNLPFTDHGATRFAAALADRLQVKAR